jgi:hypothetical protein
MLAAGAWATVSSPAARAAPCGKPDLVDMVPGDAATGVPLNATLAAHYTAAADYLGEDVVLVHPDLGEESLAAAWDATEQLLSVTPPAPLAPLSNYKIRWPALRGLNAAAAGMGGTASFMTGTGDDTAPPSFAGVARVSWDLERTSDSCTDDLVERFVFDIDLGAVSDDGGAAGLTLMLFQTEGPRVMGAPTPIPARAWPKDAAHAQVKLATDVSVGEICFAGVARDSAGHLSASGSVESCVHTTAPPFFNGCSFAGSDAGAAALPLPLALLALARRRRTKT